MGFDEFEAVTPGVVSKEAANAGDREVPLAGVSCGFETLCKPIQVFHREGRVGFFRWVKVRERLNADVELAGSNGEPTAFLIGEFGGTLEFREAEEIHKESARCGDTAGRRGELDMVEFEDTRHRQTFMMAKAAVSGLYSRTLPCSMSYTQPAIRSLPALRRAATDG